MTFAFCFTQITAVPASEKAMLMWFPNGSVTTTITSVQSKMIFVVALAVLLCPLDFVTAQGESQNLSPAQVLQDLLARYGDNTTITVPQLRSLLSLLSQDQADGISGSNVANTTNSTLPKSNSSKVRKMEFANHNCFSSTPNLEIKLNLPPHTHTHTQVIKLQFNKWCNFYGFNIKHSISSTLKQKGNPASHGIQIAEIFSIAPIVKPFLILVFPALLATASHKEMSYIFKLKSIRENNSFN